MSVDAETRGHFDLVVKRYPNGFLSEAMHKMNIGDTLDFRGCALPERMTL